MFKRLGVLLTVLTSLSMTGCSTRNIQAPFDGFVCYSQSLDQCATNAQTKDLKKYYAQTFPQKRLLFNFEDKYAGQVKGTKDNGAEKCKLGTLSYKPTLNPDKTFDIVFVSPVLLSQLAEQEVRLERAREACMHLITAYNAHSDLFAKQNESARASIAITRLAAEAEVHRLAKDNQGERRLSAEEANFMNLPATTIMRDALQKMRERGADLNEEVRTLANKQTFSIEYDKLFKDANSLIDSQLRELGRQLFVLDRSVMSAPGPSKYVGYSNGSWVQKGTIVLKIRKTDHE